MRSRETVEQDIAAITEEIRVLLLEQARISPRLFALRQERKALQMRLALQDMTRFSLQEAKCVEGEV